MSRVRVDFGVELYVHGVRQSNGIVVKKIRHLDRFRSTRTVINGPAGLPRPDFPVDIVSGLGDRDNLSKPTTQQVRQDDVPRCEFVLRGRQTGNRRRHGLIVETSPGRASGNDYRRRTADLWAQA